MIGIYGGTFDPIHYGHLRPALDVYEYLGLHTVRFIPASRPPLKNKPVISAELRATMLAAAIEGNRRFSLDTRELERKGPSYTIDTLQSIYNEPGYREKLVLLMGTDAFSRLPQWHRWEKLLDYVHIAVMQRAGEKINADGFPSAWLQDHLTSNKADLDTTAGKVIECPVTALDISSTRIRDLIKNRQSIRYLLPEKVITIINKHHLYEHN